MRAALLALAAARLGTALATAIGLPAPIDARMLPPGFEHPPMGWAMKGRSSESRWPAGCGLDPPIDAAAGALPPPSRPRCTGTGFFVTEPEAPWRPTSRPCSAS